MIYSTTNLQISLTTALADYLRSRGYDILWHATGTVESNTMGISPSKDTVTLVPDFPANPAFIVRLKDVSQGSEQIVVPALTLQIVGPPVRDAILGLGHSDYTWERELRVDGLAADEFQHRVLADLLHDWLQRKEELEIPVFDYETSPDNPVPLTPVRIVFASADRTEIYNSPDEATRYYVRATARLAYIE